MEKLRIGIIGFGQRGRNMLKNVLLEMDTVDITAVCDSYEDRASQAADWVEEKCGRRPFSTTEADEVINHPAVDAVCIFAAWECHIPLSVACMRAGKAVGVEVAGAYSTDDLWDLVRTYEETRTPIMMLENINFGRREMMIINMVKQGLFGDIVHCDGAYCHDLREEIAGGIKNRHYRLRNYMERCCDNYPTHALAPISQILNIGRGNRFVKLNSVASRPAGLHDYIVRHMGDEKELQDLAFRQGDVVTTVITCAGGETIRLTLDTTLPRFYSRQFTVHGTKGLYEEQSDSIFFDGNPDHEKWREHWGNAVDYEAEYDDPMWKDFIASGVKGGHGGTDWLLFKHFVDSLREGKPFNTDVYDMAALMCVTPLSEQSIASDGAAVEFPDFTNGKWK